MAITIRDVAQAAGVSTATVSNVLNKTGKVGAKTQRHVRSTVKRLGYVPDVHARRLASSERTTLGIIVSDIENPFFPEVIKSFETRAQQLGYDAILSDTNYDPHRTQQAAERMMEHKVRGVAIMTSEISMKLVHELARRKIAVTFLDLAPVKMNEEKSELQGLRNPEFWKDYHQNVQSQIEKINALLKDLWTASSNPSAPFSDQVSLYQVIGDTIRSHKEAFAARRIEIENRIPDDLPQLRVDKPKFTRLFELLLKEELAMLPAGSRITLKAGLSDGPPPEIVVQIHDNGPGLPEEALRAVFDPFVVRSQTPSEYGIHLMACFFIVHHHGGSIEAKTQPGQGTSFTLHLPLQAEPALASTSDTDFLRKALLNENLWEKLLSSA